MASLISFLILGFHVAMCFPMLLIAFLADSWTVLDRIDPIQSLSAGAVRFSRKIIETARQEAAYCIERSVLAAIFPSADIFVGVDRISIFFLLRAYTLVAFSYSLLWIVMVWRLFFGYEGRLRSTLERRLAYALHKLDDAERKMDESGALIRALEDALMAAVVDSEAAWRAALDATTRFGELSRHKETLDHRARISIDTLQRQLEAAVWARVEAQHQFDTIEGQLRLLRIDTDRQLQSQRLDFERQLEAQSVESKRQLEAQRLETRRQLEAQSLETRRQLEAQRLEAERLIESREDLLRSERIEAHRQLEDERRAALLARGQLEAEHHARLADVQLSLQRARADAYSMRRQFEWARLSMRATTPR